MLQSEQVGHKNLVDGSQTTLHSHPGGGSLDVKSGTFTGDSGSVTFNTAFSSTPQVVLTPQDSGLQLRDCLFNVTSVSTTGFSYETDNSATYAWIATNAGNP